MAREVIYLKEGWKFKLGEEENGWYRGLDDSTYTNVTIPHDWAVHYPFAETNSSCTGYVTGGNGWYRLKFNRKPEEGKRVFITFEGVYNNSRVWINSNYLGYRPYGYSTFTYEITEFFASDGENVLSVNVCHTETADSRWYTGSGITRPVYLTVTGEEYIRDVFVYADNIDTEKKTARVNIKTDCGGEVSHKIKKNGMVIAEAKGADTSVALTGVDLWSAENPALYTLVTTSASDEKETVFGIRDIRFDAENGLFVNGVSTKLKGVCVHHDAGCLGAAVPPAVWERRLRKLREAGTNAIRTSHNPPDPALLELCDRLGFYVMDEAFDEWEGPKNKWYHGHNRWPSKLKGYFEHFPEWGEKDIKAMVIRDRNHPSVIMWSIGNEVDYPNDPYVYPDAAFARGNNDAGKSDGDLRYDVNRPDARRLKKIAEKLVRYVKECDNTRPVTAALAYPECSDRLGYFDSLDITGYNYREGLYAARHEAHPGQVIFGSENGHGAKEWDAVKNNAYICGQFLWTGIDYLGECGGWPTRCSGAGLLDLAGYEKLRFLHRKAMWSDSLFVGIATAPTYERWNYQANWNYAEGEQVKVACPTNGERVELYWNGTRIAEGCPEGYLCEFTVSCHAGELKAVAFSADGEKAEAVLSTYSAPCELRVTEWKGSVAAYDIHQLEISLTDQDGNLCCRDNMVAVKTDGEFLGMENGDIADVTPYPSHHRKLNGGRSIAYIRGGTTAEFDCAGIRTSVKL